MKQKEVDICISKALSLTEPTDIYSEYCTIMPVSNENREAINTIMPYENCQALLPASSGEQYINAVYHDVQEVNLYDINFLTKYYTKLRTGSICFFKNRKDYLNFCFCKENPSIYLNRDVLLSMESFLSKDTFYFWNEYLKNSTEQNKQALLYYSSENPPLIDQVKTIAPYYQSDQAYQNLRMKMQKQKEIEFYQGDIYDICTSLTKKYDRIDLSNIVECKVCTQVWQYVYQYYGLEDQIEELEIQTIMDKVVPLLKEDGQMLVDYRLYLDSYYGIDACTDLLFNTQQFDVHTLDSVTDGKSAILVYKKGK